ncbi:MAG: leucine-rich repeat domain-containing protein [Bacteroidetes bacterium]|nr:leucine-rich repeat domain-containing protein [Bacteroidota bacterium]
MIYSTKNAQTTITSFTQNGETACTCQINGGEYTGANITGDIIIADGLDIPDFAFSENTKITSVTAAGNIGTIGKEAFRQSSAIFTFNNVRFIGEFAFLESSGDITFNNVTFIGKGAFVVSLGAITFNNVTLIGKGAFYESSGAITFNNVTLIGDRAFYESSGKITFNDVETIEECAFCYCLSQIYVSHQMTDAKIEEFYTPGGYKGKVKRLQQP